MMRAFKESPLIFELQEKLAAVELSHRTALIPSRISVVATSA